HKSTVSCGLVVSAQEYGVIRPERPANLNIAIPDYTTDLNKGIREMFSLFYFFFKHLTPEKKRILYYLVKYYVLFQKRCMATASTNSFPKFGLFAAKTTPAKLFASDV